MVRFKAEIMGKNLVCTEERKMRPTEAIITRFRIYAQRLYLACEEKTLLPLSAVTPAPKKKQKIVLQQSPVLARHDVQHQQLFLMPEKVKMKHLNSMLHTLIMTLCFSSQPGLMSRRQQRPQSRDDSILGLARTAKRCIPETRLCPQRLRLGGAHRAPPFVIQSHVIQSTELLFLFQLGLRRAVRVCSLLFFSLVCALFHALK
ncbi:unnamed protein product [Notodromas monacha]|uniref:Uncharacterized protein n=1 Tax=Notodromas monacha TaxID=399045 RepID=A0A7R9G9W4_9CRUS|nr:unnamed protein product [Notodromas monacha]CAG0914722.1 unnamed protein product [Notodromas monacha]